MNRGNEPDVLIINPSSIGGNRHQSAAAASMTGRKHRCSRLSPVTGGSASPFPSVKGVRYHSFIEGKKRLSVIDSDDLCRRYGMDGQKILFERFGKK